MSDGWSNPVPVPPPPAPGSVPMRVGKPRPRWSTLDTWPVFMLVALALLTLFTNASTEDGGSGSEAVDITGAALFFAVLVQQSLQFAWPVIVSKWKGLGLASDWLFKFDWKRDPIYGVGLAIAAVVSSTAVSAAVSAAVGLSADENASNTSIISDNQGSPWLIGIILLIVIGAPLSEELLFRGLLQRALERDLGIYVAVIGSAALFTIPHAQPGATSGESAVLLASLFTVGLVWGAAAAYFKRLGPTVLSHVLFNAFGVLMTINA